MFEYRTLEDKYALEVTDLSTKYNTVSYLRLGLVLIIIYLIYLLLSGGFQTALLLLLLGLVAMFVFVLRRHQSMAERKQFAEVLLKINQDELAFLEGENVYEDGAEYVDHQHPYSFDLDIFGQHSLFQYLNRTATYLGCRRLADLLQTHLSKKNILLNQEAVLELVPMLTLRQKISALALQHRDNQSVYKYLLKWSTSSDSISTIVVVLMYLLPMILLGILVAFAITLQGIYLNYATIVFIANLILLGRYHKNIRKELFHADRIDKILRQYGLIAGELELVEFKSDRLNGLKEQLLKGQSTSSQSLHDLSYLLGQLETINNGLVAMIFSGFGNYHLFVLRRIYRWKDSYAKEVPNWIEIIAQFEVLSSLATFKFNNADFAMPTISDEVAVSFSNMGHPLVKREERIGNDIDFGRERFFILTGSNMSGKSTFLRSLGVNLVLAGAGAPVCAASARVFPMKVLVSMRVADSLADHESYFYAEVKRLKQISEQIGKKGTVVLLDEILRGTNSDDKRHGTLEVIRRMVREGVFGMIATHDLEVCEEVDDHPGILANKCFEVEIKDNELYFDYKLRDGVCVNQSATFLMKKNGII